MIAAASLPIRTSCAVVPAKKHLQSGSFHSSQYVTRPAAWVTIAVTNAEKLASVPVPSEFTSAGAAQLYAPGTLQPAGAVGAAAHCGVSPNVYSTSMFADSARSSQLSSPLQS